MSRSRRFWPIWAAFCLAIALPADPFFAAQQPRREEEEDPAPKKEPPKPRAEEEEPKTQPATESPARRAPSVIDLKAEARAATNPILRDFFNRIATPHDRLTLAGGRQLRISLLPSPTLPDGELVVFELDRTLEKGVEKKYPAKAVVSFVPFERFVMGEAAALPKELAEATRLEAAAKAYGFALRNLLSSVARGTRSGTAWKEIEDQLRERWEINLEKLLAAHREARDWEQARAVEIAIRTEFGDSPPKKLAAELGRTELARLDAITVGDDDKEWSRLREASDRFVRRLGLYSDPVVQSVRARIDHRIGVLLKEATSAAEANKTAMALARLRSAEEIDPSAPAVKKARSELKLEEPICWVGVPRLPLHPSPILARTEVDRWAVELLFESLVDPYSSGESREYRPRLVEALPDVGPLSRTIKLRRDATWPEPAGGEIDARDLKLTLDEYREHAGLVGSTFPDGWESVGTSGRYDAAMILARPSPDPLSLLGMKLLPGRYLRRAKISAASEAFDRNPLGSGPYRYVGRVEEERTKAKEAGEQSREKPEDDKVMVPMIAFRASPEFALRQGHAGQPAIHEIRFYVPNAQQAPIEFEKQQLHVWLDVPPDALPGLESESAWEIKRPSVNRRVWVLAVNHRRSVLESEQLRQGVLNAIDRVAILQDVFRADAKYSKPLTGPFPPVAWPTPKKPGDTLHNPRLAAGKLTKMPAGTRLRLAYAKAAGGMAAPTVEAVCRRIQDQIRQASTPVGGSAKVEIELVALDEAAFQRSVYETFNYDLAYVPIDYEDDRYDLSALVDDRVKGLGSRNYLGYPGAAANDADRALVQSILYMRTARDADRLEQFSKEVHKSVRTQVPFVPLWQLDRPMAVSRKLDIILDETGRGPAPEALDLNLGMQRAELWIMHPSSTPK